MYVRLSDTFFELLEEIHSFLFPFIVNVSFSLKSNHRYWSHQGRLTNHLTLLTEISRNLRYKTENKSDFLSWFNGLFRVMAEKLRLDIFYCISINSGLIFKSPFVIDCRRTNISYFYLLCLYTVELLFKR